MCDMEKELAQVKDKVEKLDSYGLTFGDFNMPSEHENELTALLNHIYPKFKLDIKGIQAVNNALVLAYALWVDKN